MNISIFIILFLSFQHCFSNTINYSNIDILNSQKNPTLNFLDSNHTTLFLSTEVNFEYLPTVYQINHRSSIFAGNIYYYSDNYIPISNRRNMWGSDFALKIFENYTFGAGFKQLRWDYYANDIETIDHYSFYASYIDEFVSVSFKGAHHADKIRYFNRNYQDLSSGIQFFIDQFTLGFSIDGLRILDNYKYNNIFSTGSVRYKANNYFSLNTSYTFNYREFRENLYFYYLGTEYQINPKISFSHGIRIVRTNKSDRFAESLEFLNNFAITF